MYGIASEFFLHKSQNEVILRPESHYWTFSQRYILRSPFRNSPLPIFQKKIRFLIEKKPSVFLKVFHVFDLWRALKKCVWFFFFSRNISSPRRKCKFFFFFFTIFYTVVQIKVNNRCNFCVSLRFHILRPNMCILIQDKRASATRKKTYLQNNSLSIISEMLQWRSQNPLKSKEFLPLK